MCLYWKKIHTCGHPSDRPYLEMCRPGFLSNTVCLDIQVDDHHRPSHFPCYPCIKLEARAEIEAQARIEHDALTKACQARERAVKERQAAELKAKEDRVRREAREKAAKEREAEQRAKREKEEEERRAKKEGGPWIETSGGKKTKGKRSGGGSHGIASSPTGILSSLPVAKMATAPRNTKENSAVSGGGGGRAGTWGPKKILSRQENSINTSPTTKK